MYMYMITCVRVRVTCIMYVYQITGEVESFVLLQACTTMTNEKH